MIKKICFSTFLFIFIVGFSYMNSFAQSSDASTKMATLKGTVIESTTGNPISDIEVQLHENENTAMTDSTGHFEFSGLESGKYTLYIEADGYKEHEQEVDLTKGDATVTVKLEPVSDEEEE